MIDYAHRLPGHFVLRSFGYGVFAAEMLIDRKIKNGDACKEANKTISTIQNSGFPNILEVIGNPDNPSKAFLLTKNGHPPCPIERDLMTQDDRDQMIRAVTSSNSEALSQRLGMLKIQLV